MKRLWLGIGILGAILLLSFWVQLTMGNIHYTAAERLDEASEAALAGNWDSALSLAGSASELWKSRRNFTAALADQTPMDEVDMLLAELEIHAAEQEAAGFCAACARLSQLLKATADAHTLSWPSLL